MATASPEPVASAEPVASTYLSQLPPELQVMILNHLTPLKIHEIQDAGLISDATLQQTFLQRHLTQHQPTIPTSAELNYFIVYTFAVACSTIATTEFKDFDPYEMFQAIQLPPLRPERALTSACYLVRLTATWDVRSFGYCLPMLTQLVEPLGVLACPEYLDAINQCQGFRTPIQPSPFAEEFQIVKSRNFLAWSNYRGQALLPLAQVFRVFEKIAAAQPFNRRLVDCLDDLEASPADIIDVLERGENLYLLRYYFDNALRTGLAVRDRQGKSKFLLNAIPKKCNTDYCIRFQAMVLDRFDPAEVPDLVDLDLCRRTPMLLEKLIEWTLELEDLGTLLVDLLDEEFLVPTSLWIKCEDRLEELLTQTDLSYGQLLEVGPRYWGRDPAADRIYAKIFKMLTASTLKRQLTELLKLDPQSEFVAGLIQGVDVTALAKFFDVIGDIVLTREAVPIGRLMFRIYQLRDDLTELPVGWDAYHGIWQGVLLLERFRPRYGKYLFQNAARKDQPLPSLEIITEALKYDEPWSPAIVARLYLRATLAYNTNLMTLLVNSRWHRYCRIADLPADY
jgi:hypothetical protein